MKSKLKSEKINSAFLSLLIIISLCNVGLSAQPQIEVDKTNINFGDVNYKDSPVKEKIIIKNVGTDTLFIREARPDCGCTIAPLATNELPPNDSTILSIDFDIKNFTGRVTRNINIFSNDPQKPTVTVALNCNVIRAFSVVPQYMNFDRVFVGEPFVIEMQVVNNSSTDAVVKSVSVDNPDVIVSIQANDVIKKDESFIMKATAIATKTGSMRTNITIEVFHPDEKRIEILGFGNAVINSNK